MQSEQINEFATALAKAQGVMPNAKFDKQNPHFRSDYASLAAVINAVREPLSLNNLAFTQTMDYDESGQFFLRTTLMHSSGQWKDSAYPLPLGAKPHEMGMHITYARRYSLSSVTGLAADDDDDGNAALASGQKHEATDYVAMGGAIITALAQCTSLAEIDKLEALNKAAIVRLSNEAPQVAARIGLRFGEARKKLKSPTPPETAAGNFLADLGTEMTVCKTRKGLDLVWANNKAAIDAMPPEDFDAAAKLYEKHLGRIEK